jgi:hypothetical protein
MSTQKKMILFTALLMSLVTLAIWLVSKPGNEISLQEARRIATSEAGQMCERRSQKEDIDCITLDLNIEEHFAPSIFDRDGYAYFIKLSARNHDQTKTWDFDITLYSNGTIAEKSSYVSSTKIE